MTAPTAWETANSKYLSMRIAEVRLRLEKVLRHESSLDNQDPLAANPTTPQDEAPGHNHELLFAELADLEAGMDPPPALILLARTLGLSEFEQNIVMFCVAAELDPRISTLCAKAQCDGACGQPTFALALSVFDDPAWDALSPERPLRFWRIIDINQPGARPLTASPLRLDERIMNFVKGLNYLDDRLAPYVAAFPSSLASGPLPSSQQSFVENMLSYLHHGLPTRSPVIQLLGNDTMSKQLVASCVAAELGRNLYRISIDAFPQQAADIENLARLWQRESALLPVALYIDAHDSETTPTGAQCSPMSRFLARTGGLIFLSAREAWPGLGCDSWPLEIEKPTHEEQQAAWEHQLGAKNSKKAAQLADQFNMNLPSIERIIGRAKFRSPNANGHLPDTIWEECCAELRPRLDSLAQRLDTKATWKDIVLPEDETSLLRQIAAQVKQRGKVYHDWGFARKMNRGLGISALFAGESGTGKTMAAEVIANDLRLNLYRIDLSAVVSKYIGETEKNLRRLFDAAEEGGAILFFDEADALFGKRSEVKDSHDRYANIEINYLLQRMEGYRGLAIMATNMRSALDTAFTRRLRFIVNFPFPNVADRRRIWQKTFPPQTPVQGLDFERLARLNLTGGGIHNAAINAAFRAADAGKPVSMAEALMAARSEFIKLDRPIRELDFHFQETGVEA